MEEEKDFAPPLVRSSPICKPTDQQLDAFMDIFGKDYHNLVGRHTGKTFLSTLCRLQVL